MLFVDVKVYDGCCYLRMLTIIVAEMQKNNLLHSWAQFCCKMWGEQLSVNQI